MKTSRLCFACDLKDDPKLIEEYKRHHETENIWPEITKSIKDAGIMDMQIFLVGNRLFMIMEVDATYSPDRKLKMDSENETVQEWEEKMMQFQQFLPFDGVDSKWVEMERIFALE